MNIITSLLDTDFYKLTMMQAVYHKYTAVPVKYKFKWRNFDQMKFNISLENFVEQINEQIDQLCKLKFTDDELNYLNKIPFIKSDFIEFLRLFKLNRNYVKTKILNGEIDITIKGPWLNTIMFEVPILAIISELYTKQIEKYNYNFDLDIIFSKLNNKSPFSFGDFGTRRRKSKLYQEYILSNRPKKLIGTSNVYFAKKLNLKPLGTHAHEWFQVHQQLNSRLIDSQSTALQAWVDEYRGDLGIALSDCITFDAFLVDFDKYFAKLYDGCRHDSGCPFIWGEKLIKHYEKLNIDPKTKTALFSDNLTFEKIEQLYNVFNNRIKTAFGIGTNLTNEVNFLAPQIVIKVVEANNLPVAKVSDSNGKEMCEDVEFLKYLKKIIKEKCKI